MCLKADISQLNLLHATENKNRKNKEEKLKTKTDMLRRNGPVKVHGVSPERGKVYGGKVL